MVQDLGCEKMVGHEKDKRAPEVSFRPQDGQTVRPLPIFVSKALDLHGRTNFPPKKVFQDLAMITRHDRKTINGCFLGGEQGSV
jgi:hypothetical protein